MIITVTLNAAIDKSLSVPNFRLGRRHRTVEQRTMAGGKGVNIARTLKTLGQPVIATGFAGGITGTHIVEQLTEESILNDFVRIREESRTNTSVLDPTTGEQTEINERGPSVSQHEVELFRDKLLYLARGAAIVVFAGSLPRGLEPDIYAVLIRELERTGVTTVIDTEGDPLRQAVRAEPDVVSPNVIEAEELVGHEFASEEERSLGVREIAALGPREAIMTLPDGCFAQVLVDGQPCLRRAERAAARVDRQTRLRRRLPGRLHRRALRGSYAGPVPALRRGLRGRVHRRLGAGLIDPREARRLMGEVELPRSSCPLRLAELTVDAARGHFRARLTIRPRRPAAGRRGTPRTAPEPHTARRPRPSARSASSRSGCAAGRASSRTVR